MRDYEKIYFDQDVRALSEITLPREVKAAWQAHWNGNLVRARQIYARIPFRWNDPLSQLISADHMLLGVKCGDSLGNLPEKTMSLSSRIVLEVARFWWVTRRYERPDSLRGLLIASFFHRAHGVFLMAVSLQAELWARQFHEVGFFVSRAIFEWFSKSLMTSFHPCPLARFTVLSRAANLYLTCHRIRDKSVHSVLEVAERWVAQDGFHDYFFLTQVAQLLAIRGETTRSELYASKLFRLAAGDATFHRPTLELIALLPYAVGGYGQFIQEPFLKLMTLRPHHATWEAGVFNQIAYWISICLGREDLAKKLVTPSISVFRPKAVLASQSSYSALISDLIQSLPSALTQSAGWYEETMLGLIKKHLGWGNILRLKEPTSEFTDEPCIRIGSDFVFFLGVPSHRKGPLNEVLSVLGPVASALLSVVEKQKHSHEIEKAADLAKLAAQVVHDIRSPLAGIKFLSEKVTGLSVQERHLFDQGLERMQAISRTLLDAYRTDVLTPEEKCDLGVVVQFVVEEKQTQMESHGKKVTLSWKNHLNGSSVKMDSQTLKRCLVNLIENAWDAVLKEGRIEIECLPNGKTAEIRIRDSGAGIPSQLLSKVTSLGFSFGKSHGTGLGLAYVKEQIESRGGSMEIQSERGRGTEVRLFVPYAS